MKKIVQINGVLTGSTGKIARQLAEITIAGEDQMMVCVPKGRHNKFIATKYSLCMFGSRLSEDLHIILSRITGFNGCFSYFATRRLLKKISDFQPNILHLHNLHNSYINLPLLFKYIKKHELPVVWTLHDCWAFTGQCPYFVLAKCDKWKNGCHHCTQYRAYPQSMVDRTKRMWKLKKKWFTGVKNLTIVTPSQWLAGLVKESFLGMYPVKVINNGIDLNVFKPTESEFRKKHGLQNKKIVLGVAFGWGRRKGLDVFVDLAKRLDENFQIVLVGTDDEVDKQLPSNIISIHRTQNQAELAELYSTADVFANPTREEVLGMVNVEALACGTPVVTFQTGGSPECIDETCGCVVDCDDVDGMAQKIKYICEKTPYSAEACLKRAAMFASNIKFREYIHLYEELS